MRRRPIWPLYRCPALILLAVALASLLCYTRAAPHASAHTQLAFRNDVAGVRAAIAKGAHVDAADTRGHTCLLHAARWGHSALAEELLKEHGASVDVKESINGNAALNYAAHQGHAGIAQTLLLHGADHRLTDDDGWTPLMSASSNGHLDVVKMLLPLSSVRPGGDPETDPGNTRDWQNHDGTTPLMAALDNGHVHVANALLDAGADVNRRKWSGANAVTIAAREGLTTIVSRLISLGANVNVIEEPDHEITENEGSTPLMKAVYKGHAQICKVLVDAGADVDFKEETTGRTALQRAALQGFAHITKILVDGGADVTGDFGATALNVAVMFGHSDVEKVLLDAGAVRHISRKPKTGRETNKGRGSDVADAGDFNMMDMMGMDGEAMQQMQQMQQQGGVMGAGMPPAQRMMPGRGMAGGMGMPGM